MKYLLDTHVFVWALIDPTQLSEKVKKILENKKALYLSTISLWEISLKFSLGKIQFDGLTPEELFSVGMKWGLELLPVSGIDAIRFYRLKRLHKDPFDRMIVWQSISNGMTLLSKDSRMTGYREFGLSLIW